MQVCVCSLILSLRTPEYVRRANGDFGSALLPSQFSAAQWAAHIIAHTALVHLGGDFKSRRTERSALIKQKTHDLRPGGADSLFVGMLPPRSN